MILSLSDTSRLTRTGINLSVESPTSYFHVSACGYAPNVMAGIMAGEWYAI